MWTRPAYGTASLADVLPSALATLGAPDQRDPLGLTGALAGVDRIAVLLVDGLGWYNLATLTGPATPTLAAVASGALGASRPITTGFPSTTPTSLVSLGTGATPGQHGVLGFTVAVPGTDHVLVHVHWPAGPEPLTWQPVPVLAQAAARAGIRTATVNHPDFATSNLTLVSTGTAGYTEASGAAELAEGMLAALAAPGPALVYGYFAEVDRAGHEYGLTSPEWLAAAVTLDTMLTRLIAGLPYGSALIITADHGQLDIPPDRRLDLGTDARLRDGLRVVAGEPRVRYLHTRPGAADDVAATWRGVLGPAATVLHRDEVIAEGLYGGVAPGHRERIGDLVVICADDWAIMATGYEPPRVSQLIAYHGALTPAEMTIPLVVIQP